MILEKSFIVMGCIFFFVLYQGCKPKYEQGGELYEAYCSNCHMSDGTGLIGLIPPLKDADYYQLHMANMPCIIKYGLTDTIRVNGREFHQEMEGFPKLTDSEILNIINFMNNQWYPDVPETTMRAYKQHLSKCE